MAYIGKTPVIGNFVKLDSITVVNGQAAYTMQNGGVNFTSYDNVNQFLVSLNGVLQAPTDSFTVSGSTLTFASNLSTGDVIDFVLVLGNSLDIGTPSDNTISTAKLQDNAITSAKLASGAVPNQSAFKNLFINGDMSIAQRGTTSSSTGYQTVDRWQLNTGTQQEQKTDTPDARFSNSFEVTGTTSGSSGYGICSQRIESKNVLQALGQTCTLSAYVKNTGTSTVNVSCEVYRANSTDTFSGLTLLTSLTSQAITSGWTRITFPSFTVTDACSTGLEVRIFRYDASNNQEWLITGVQLEVGSSASDFEFLPFDVNLARCHRYCYVMGAAQNAEDQGQFTIGTGMCRSSGSAIFTDIVGSYPQPLRTLPSLTQDGGSLSDVFCYKTNGTSANPTSISVSRNTIALRLGNNMGLSSGLTAGDATVQQINETNTNLIFDAEL